jgi:hypothetical protein
MVSKKALLEVTYHIVKIHVNNDVTIVLEFLIFLVVKKIEENIQDRLFLQSNTL